MALLILLLIVVPIAELYVIVRVGQEIGVLWTIALLLADSLLGAWLLRHEGRAVWRRFRATIDEGRLPARETIDGVLVIGGGALLMTPGFLSDIVGITMLLPPSRRLIGALLTRRFGGRARFETASYGTGSRSTRRPDDIDSTATEVPAPGRGLPGSEHDER